MTVTYLQHIHTAGKVGAFLRLLIIWKGSIFKGIWRDLVMFLFFYFLISFIYRFGLLEHEDMKQNFERLCVYFGRFDDWIPIGFVLGFYVTQVVQLWWGMFNAIPWPDHLALNLISFLPGAGEKRRVRRYVVRLANLSAILCLRRISTGVARRFPTYDHLVEAGLMTKREMEKMEKMNTTVENLHQTTWYPLQWAQARLLKCREKGWIKSDFMLMELHKNLNDLSGFNGSLLCYTWVNIPLVYTQLVTLAVHVYFLVALFGRQFLHPTMYKAVDGEFVSMGLNRTIPGVVNLVGYDHTIHDFYFPLFTMLEFVFYFGWLKVAEILINPFGDDDEDFDLNYVLDRNFQVSYIMVNGDADEELEEDTYNDEIPPPMLPHTRASAAEADNVPVYITDEVIEEVTEKLEDNEPLFVSPSRLSLDKGSASNVSPAPSDSNILQSIKRNFSNVLGTESASRMKSIDEGVEEEDEEVKIKLQP